MYSYIYSYIYTCVYEYVFTFIDMYVCKYIYTYLGALDTHVALDACMSCTRTHLVCSHASHTRCDAQRATAKCSHVVLDALMSCIPATSIHTKTHTRIYI